MPLLSDADIEEINEAIRWIKQFRRRMSSMTARVDGGVADVQHLRVTGEAAVNGRWPAKVQQYDANENTWLDGDDAFVIDPNGEALSEGTCAGRRQDSYCGRPVYTIADGTGVGLGTGGNLSAIALDNVPSYSGISALYFDEADGYRLSPRDITTTLNGSIDAVTTTVVVTSGAAIANGDVIQIDNEHILVNSGGGTSTLLVSRGQSTGAAAASHSNGANVYRLNGNVRLDFVAATASQAGNVSLSDQTMGDGEKYFQDYVSVNNSSPAPAGPLDVTTDGAECVWLHGDGVGGKPSIKFTDDPTNAEYVYISQYLTGDELLMGGTQTSGLISFYLTSGGGGNKVGINLSAGWYSVGANTGVDVYDSGNPLQVCRVDGGIVTSAFTGPLTVGGGGTGLTSVTQFAVLYGNGTSAFGVTNAPSSGQLLVGGSAPAFVTMSGDATLASSGALTIANDAVTYAKMQNVSATARVLGRKTASAGDAEECTLSEVLDFIGSAAQGDILYRGAATWARLGAGTSGYFLKTQGAGANPMWDSAGSSYTTENAQDDVGGILVDSTTIDFTYNDGTPSITAAVIKQMSITSDGSGLKLVNDEAAPADNYYYGTNLSSAGVPSYCDFASTLAEILATGAGAYGPTWVPLTKSHTDFQTAATTNTIALYTAPAGAVLHAVKVKHSVAFAGTGLMTYTISVQNAGETFVLSFDVKQAVAGTTYKMYLKQGGFGSETFDHSATTAITIKADCSGGNLNASTAGTVEIWLLLSVAA